MLLDEVKVALRITHSKLDTEISQHIAACCDDLRRVGVEVPDDTDSLSPLLVIAVLLYCKEQYDFIGKGEEFGKGYRSLRDSLSLSGDYREAEDV